MRQKSATIDVKSKNKHVDRIRVAIYTTGMLIADEDIVSLNPFRKHCCAAAVSKATNELKLPNYTKSLKCISLGGQLLAIDMAEVKSNRVKFHEEVWNMIEDRAKQRKYFTQRAEKTCKVMKFE